MQPPVAKRYFFLKKSPKQGSGQRPEVLIVPRSSSLPTLLPHAEERACEGEKGDQSVKEKCDPEGVTESRIAEDEREQKHQSEKQTTVQSAAERGRGAVNPPRDHTADESDKKRDQERNGADGRVGVGKEVDREGSNQ